MGPFPFRFAATVAAPLALVACSAGAPEAGEETAAPEGSGDMTPDSVDIVEAASATGNLDTFLQLALQVGIGERIATTPNLTLFAPIDQAFESLEGMDGLRADQARLRRVLEAHVVQGEYLSSAIPDGETQVETLAGVPLTIRKSNGQIEVIRPSGTEAMVVQADIDGDNGVVHAIETVLMP